VEADAYSVTVRGDGLSVFPCGLVLGWRVVDYGPRHGKAPRVDLVLERVAYHRPLTAEVRLGGNTGVADQHVVWLRGGLEKGRF